MVTAASGPLPRPGARALHRGAVVCAPTAAVAAEVAAEYGAPDRLVVTPLGIDPSWHDHPTRPGLAGRHGSPPLPPVRRQPRAPQSLAGLLAAYRHLLAGVGVGNGPAAG